VRIWSSCSLKNVTNEPQPDAFLRILPEHGGQSKVDSDDYINGAPEFVAEVAATSVNYDLNVKLNAYRRNQVEEYLVWRTLEDAVDWFILRGGQYTARAPGPDGILRSEVLPGLWLDPDALIRRDPPALMNVGQKGIASPEHAAFVAKLASASK